MLSCEQTQSQNVFQHGLSVLDHFNQLTSLNSTLESDWRIPSWYWQHRKFIIKNIHDKEIAEHYLLYHDCGKPYCLIQDELGNHFPNHAEISKQTFIQIRDLLLAPHQKNMTADLIGWDMVLHTASAQEIDDYLKIWTLEDCMTLLIAALAEVHSNSRMFGGIESNSFKSKWKRINRRGKQILKSLKKEK